MTHTWPTPRDLGVKVPTHLVEQRFRAGFNMRWKANNLLALNTLSSHFARVIAPLNW